jgi:hypothetical protein
VQQVDLEDSEQFLVEKAEDSRHEIDRAEDGRHRLHG